MDGLSFLEVSMRVSVFVTRLVEVNKTAMRRIAKAVEEGLCCACMQPLGKGRVVRGLHMTCLKATYRAIAAGKCTEDERVQEGKMLSKTKGGRKPSNPVTVDLASK